MMRSTAVWGRPQPIHRAAGCGIWLRMMWSVWWPRSIPRRPVSVRILFITATRIGDAVLSTGVLRYLVDTYPAARFTIACGPLAASLFAGVPRLDDIIVLDKRPMLGHWLALWRRTCGTRWDVV